MRGDGVRTELARVIAAGPEVVVDHIEQDSKPRFVGSIYETLQPIGAAVWVVNGIERHAIVAPAVPPVERCHRHKLDVSHSEIAQVVEFADCRIEGALRREGSDVQLVDDGARQRRRWEMRIVPVELILVINARKLVNSGWLSLRTRIRIGLWVVINEKTVIGS